MDLIEGNITLRGFREEDATSLVPLCNNRNIWKNVRDAFPHPYTLKDARAFIKTATSSTPREIFAVTFDDQLVGCIGIHPQDDVYRFTAEVGYWIGEPFWGLGIATRALRLVVSYGFEKLGVMRIFAGCFDFNAASQKVLLKAGFSKEAILKKTVFKNQQFCDEIRYAILKEDD
ncbi:MAG TPA: GNAT family protein [Eudoraea sp.]|nr:GNAT family protein [Eudoraea sp.]